MGRMTDGMSDRIALLIPSRGRPDMLYDMWTSALMHAAQPSKVLLLVALDDDDVSRHVTIERFRPSKATISIGPRRLLAEYWNDLAALTDAEILWHGNDDVLFRTYAWDEMVRAEFDRWWPDRIACVHGRDGIHDAGMATLGFYSREWVNTLGYVTPPYFSSDWCDTWLSWCADQLGRRCFLPDMLTEHLHPAVGKGVMDETHRERLARGAQDGVDQRYTQLQSLRELDVTKLRAAITTAAAEVNVRW